MVQSNIEQAASGLRSPASGKRVSHSYFVVMCDYGKRGLEAIVDPEITRREVVSRIRSGEYKNIAFIHSISDGAREDITEEVKAEAAAEPANMGEILRAAVVAAEIDHARDYRKHEVA